ncbi:S-locus-specific glycoprotein S13-like isoform X1 [Quercus robur]|uniref:S-locus-specific glycoprotein S13-like isoform X1 n=1 Tax=Quercus robur TaxID=38942 RepID=UPI002162FA8F|nr:S-locus-specific glycoprotein S13-like isoform X1 [Quercus robur]
MKSMNILSFIFMLTYLLFLFSKVSLAGDRITPSQNISGTRTLVSNNGSFELGFFSLFNSNNHYLGIWYKKISVRTVVWVANRLNPINDSSGLLMINRTGSLVVMSQNKSVVWSTGLGAQKQANNPVLQLLDSGNLVLRDGNSETSLWESFDYPSNTLLPGMKLGWDLRKGINWNLTEWTSPDDPSPGDLTYWIERHSYPDPVIQKGTNKFYRTGPWNGLWFSGSPGLNPVYDEYFVSNEYEVYYTYTLKNKSEISRIILNEMNTFLERHIWNEASQIWLRYPLLPRDHCDNYGFCGPNANCIIGYSGFAICQCLLGFKPKSPERWSLMERSQGCVLIKPLSCQKDGFNTYFNLKLPDTTNSWVNESMSLNECSAKCLNNCSCMAYSNSDIRESGRGCVMWFGDLMDIRQFPDGGQNLYVRISASEIVAREHGRWMNKAWRGVVAVAVVAVMVGVVLYIYRRRTNIKDKIEAFVRKQSWFYRFKGENIDEITPQHEMQLSSRNTSTIGSTTNIK